MRLLLIVSMMALLFYMIGCSAKTPVTKPVVKNGGTTINVKDGSVMVLIPAGTFKMGYPKGLFNVYATVTEHDVYLSAYYISMYPVTVEQYQKFCQATGRKMPPAPRWGWIGNHPIVNVKWHNANEYAKWAGCQLPSDAQWEKAASGTDGREYPWGNYWDSNNAQCRAPGSAYPDSTAPVGSFPSGASPYGVMDMSGNVRVWCADWYDEYYYLHSPKKNPTGPTNGVKRVLRGGADLGVENDYSIFMCDNRDCYAPDKFFDDIGFRCVKMP